MKRTLILALAGVVALSCSARELDRLDGAKLAAYGGNDGDSFKTLHNGKEQIIRLYYVDCPETRATTEADNRRVREQARHFGLSDKNQIFRYGKAATAFTQKQLSKPFTVHTAYADALGRSKGGRVYGFVTTADGKDLAALLVENGYARAYGFRRALPDGTPQKEAAARLTDKETVAALKRKGIWAQTDPDRLVELRAASRLEEAELNAIDTPAHTGILKINTATEDELQTINGVGPATARRIVELRPFKNADDLGRLPRLPAKTKTNIIERVAF
ncbi:thermonuclease family protein [Pontiella sulfatireligans]|uniref:Thermonuclease n=1 Tax=Pontiella sulfatireligans TaxID=2750658 RepID=A0A6C2UR54_9BACT|nr:thermonuclease family protein [Pontiella sulfatireligans]VGO22718.1 Thermonuclease [Pontiella sulfatireligans]